MWICSDRQGIITREGGGKSERAEAANIRNNNNNGRRNEQYYSFREGRGERSERGG